uniref:CASP C-terminal domain-containing protein n=1 Tax=Dunaliella tertiolecta TaxID=3047 RepID=A0A7S3QQS9_DUNTE
MLEGAPVASSRFAHRYATCPKPQKNAFKRCKCAWSVFACRYVHGFKQRKNAQDVESGLDAEKRYGRMYDEGINPFAEFQGQQRERQKSSMPLPDRLMYRFGQLVFGSQSARLGTFIYLCGLHLLVLLLISRMTHSGSSDMYAQQLHIMENSRHAMTAAMHHEPGSSEKSSHALPPPSIDH